MKNNYLAQFFGKSQNYTDIPNRLYAEYNVKKGLRNEDGTGVRIGLTKVSDVVGYTQKDGKKEDAPGDLFYRGYSISGLSANKRPTHGYEEICFLLLFGYLPKKEELAHFCDVLKEMYELPYEFLETNILRTPAKNLMNKLQQAVLALYNYDDEPDDIDEYKTLIKGVNLIAKMPSIICYEYVSKMHYFNRQSLVLHYPRKEYSIAENFLYMLREDRTFTEKEANLLDVLLMLHADHGGGNNSTFTNVVISSTGTDIYSTICGSIGSLKGPRHGGANSKVVHMHEDIRNHVKNWDNDDEIAAYLEKILRREAFDGSGLIYGMGHAVYTLSDPRAKVCRHYAEAIADEKGLGDEFRLIESVERLAPQVMRDVRGTSKPICANIDLYTGFIYSMLGIPQTLFTPMFAVARTAGWAAHRMEELFGAHRIIRPAYNTVYDDMEYVPLSQR